MKVHQNIKHYHQKKQGTSKKYRYVWDVSLAAPIYLLPCLSFIYLSTITKTHKKLPFSACSYSLLKITCHYLLLFVGFDTLTYRKGYDRSPTLVGHQDHFLAPLSGSVALLVSGIGKETFQLYVLFFILVYYFA